MTSMKTIVPAAMLFAALTAFAPAPARFHAHLVKADPAVNDTITTIPRTIRLWFSEPVELALSRVQIVRVGGDTVRTTALRREGPATTAAADLTTTASAPVPGTYVVTYRVVARDGHPTSGEYRFVIKGE